MRRDAKLVCLVARYRIVRHAHRPLRRLEGLIEIVRRSAEARRDGWQQGARERFHAVEVAQAFLAEERQLVRPLVGIAKRHATTSGSSAMRSRSKKKAAFMSALVLAFTSDVFTV